MSCEGHIEAVLSDDRQCGQWCADTKCLNGRCMLDFTTFHAQHYQTRKHLLLLLMLLGDLMLVTETNSYA